MIVAAVLPWALGAVVLALLLSAWRLLRGPGVADRVLALDTLYVNALLLTVLLGLRAGSGLYFEVALLIGLLGFIGTVLVARYAARGSVVE